MKISVKVFASLRTFMPGEIGLELAEGSTITDLLVVLGRTYPELQKELFTEEGILRRLVNILQNGRNIIHVQGLKSPLSSGDLIAIFPPVAGG